ncbi:unnamed protein product [Miscanthus lutarioriparius]|uniref:Receptor kinase-like protein Xa21 n=1 Tax=Miscanthus lutarioriparius TaxID=422564 RepID=A0A811P9Z7_9POAL|nr:unnamed protein product [Miscanthus lutarioriparius]
MLMLLAILLVTSHGVGNISCSTVPENSTDSLALLDFKAAITNDPSGSLMSSWNTSIHCCKWRGVTCNSKNHGRVTALNLTGQGLSGSISPSVGNLTFLHTLDLSTNHFSGQIPHLNNLQKMQILNLSYNSLDGVIPNTLTNCSNLKQLHLNHNLLNGAIPREIGLLEKLVFFALNNNNLTGTIPPTLGNITHIEEFFLQENQLEGTIPGELGQFSNISMLDLGGNNLSGTIPASLFNLSLLQGLDLHANQLSGSLPSNMGDRLFNLQRLYLGENWLEGRIPDSLCNASMLQQLVLQSNNFTGQIPGSFGKLSSLSTLDLGLNMLEAKDSESWEFLHALENCSALKVLALSNNQLQGVIPNSVGNLSSSLQYLILGGNKLSGTIPPNIGKLSGLVQLSLDESSLTGSIDGWLGDLKNLQYLNLRKNNLSGPIPPSTGNLTWLVELFLDNNGFEGPMPSSLGTPPLLLKLNLSHNNLEGSIPLEISNLKQLINLELASNKLTGEIPDDLALCRNLVTINMERNFIAGNIPESVGNLENLNKLNLAHNNLSGTIPTALGNLQLLNMLDLSYNDLQGEIPMDGIFRNVSSVYLDGNMDLCGGAFDLHMPSCPSFSQRIESKCTWFNIFIPIVGFMSLIMFIYVIFFEKKTSRTSYTSMLSFGKKFPRISYKDVAEATRNFSELNLIGRGSYGSVYRGKLTQAKIQVAIKVFDLGIQCADRSFLSECEALRAIKHRNIVPILTACTTIDNKGNDFVALVYEFMPNGNLDTWLHHRCAGVAPECLTLAQRISIAVGIADALAYLHNDCGRPIIHCDLKPTNILLDDDMNAHLGDFGISRLLRDSTPINLGHSGSNGSVTIKGTIGYIPPEYAQSVHASTSGDVYSFGIILLEMLIGKRPTDSMFEGEMNIVSFVEKNFPKQMSHIIDAHLQEESMLLARVERGNEVRRCLMSLVGVALSCTRLLPSERMNMRQVTANLNAARRSYGIQQLPNARADHSSLEPV